MTITNNPAGDAERHDNYQFAQQEADRLAQEQEARELADAEAIAPTIVFNDLQAITTPGDWFKPGLIAGGYETADQLLWDAIQEDSECERLYAEYAISKAAYDLQKALANWNGKRRAMAVVQEHKERQQ